MVNGFTFFVVYLILSVIVAIIVFEKLKRKTKNIVKLCVYIYIVFGALTGLALSILIKASILETLFLIILFAGVGGGTMYSKYKLRKFFGKDTKYL